MCISAGNMYLCTQKVILSTYKPANMKRLILIAATFVLSLTAWGQTISEQEAKSRAIDFLTQRAPAMTRGQRASALKKKLETTKLEVSGLYVFNLEGGGFVIASGDERTLPILGYSDRGTIDWQHMPSNIKAWLSDYSTAIEALGNASLSRGEQSSSPRQAIAPLLPCLWNQYEPYWDQCPDVEGGRALTGCVATAMAQVMYYHRWPQAACEKIPAHTFPNSKASDMTLDELPQTTFDWARMETDLSEVAKLMRYCGQSVKMQYGSGESDSDGTFVAQSARHYFGYDQGVTTAIRSKFGIDAWEQLIYDELAAKRPVVYCGQSGMGGHCFVCDGYDGNGLFHINWGWGGKSDGYFALSVLNPYNNTGAGASSSKLGYCMGQQAIIGMQPPTGTSTPSDESPMLAMYENMYISKDTVKINTVFESLMVPKATFEVALGTISSDGVLTPSIKAEKTHEIESPFDATFDVVVNSQKLSKGTYQLAPMARCVSTDGNWHLMQVAEKKIQVDVSDDGVAFKLVYLPDISIEKSYISKGPRIISEYNEITLVIKNKGNEYAGNLRLRAQFLGDKTADEVLKNLPPVSDLDRGTKIGGYFRKESTDSLLIPYDNALGSKGNYLLLLYEDRTDVLLGSTTVAFDQDYEFEFVDLEVVAYKLELTKDCILNYNVIIKNNDTKNNWPKYSGRPDLLHVEFIDPDFGGGGNYNDNVKIEKGKEVTLHDHFEVWSDPETVTFFIEERLCDGQVKRIFEKSLKPGETLTFPEETSISNVPTSEDDSPSFFDLKGQLWKEKPTKKGIYIQNNRKVLVK